MNDHKTEQLNIEDLQDVSGGASVSYGYWKPAFVTGASQGQGSITLYRTPDASPQNVLLQLQAGDQIFINPDRGEGNWVFAKVRNVVLGYIEARYVSDSVSL